MKLRPTFPKLRRPSPRTLLVIAAVALSPIAVAALAAKGADSSPDQGAPSAGAPAAPDSGTGQGARDAGTKDAGTNADAAAAASLQQCRTARLVPTANGWGVPVPSVWASSSTACNLMSGDSPYRGGQRTGDPDTAIRTLQRNLNYCYGSKLTVDGLYGSNTRSVVKQVQQRHGLTADGIYGPRTRSAMNWRLFHSAKGIWSTGCYSPL
ncbi:putative peptidoglycan binding protein [Kribbella amoyensis]|uniref:Putative peptidoglycan binding protein n=1 Tax=Kribbella amoyensis TaxID=996641 RepID=A0A561BKP9_9ACTN|nr:peptidoglycan-binding domain-containing protein [Kribbella amoyensis]TWD79425.1 putative peptidoglycan binding protein [Kribbella amoyensis]